METPPRPPVGSAVVDTGDVHAAESMRLRPMEVQDDKARVVQTLLFVGGINTLLQTLFGTRLPTVIGGSYTSVVPSISIIHDPSLQNIENDHQRFLQTMRAIQGALIVSSSIQIILGYSQLWAICSRFFSPLGMVPVVALVGFGLLDKGFPVEKGADEVVFKAMGRAINKTVMIVEIIKRRIIDLHQNTAIGSMDITDYWEPLEEGLLPLETTRHVSMISITLSKKELDASSVGIDLRLVITFFTAANCDAITW